MGKGTEKIVAVLLSLLILLSPVRASAASSENALPSGIAKADIGAEIEAFVAEHQNTTAGMAVSVFDRSGVLYQNDFGHSDIANGIPVDRETVFEWGSVTKLLVWVSAMQLVEQGKLDLETDIQQYLPEGFLKNLRYDTPVTMLHLMNHNAGFEDTFLGMMTHREDQIRSLEAYLTDVQPRQIFQPGEVTAYSNWGVTLAGYIVERISGMPFYQYVHEHIFTPLGMEHSALNADLSDNPWVKERWEKLKCYTTSLQPIPERGKYIIMYPAGMCTSTPEDFATFAQALLNRESPLFRDPATYDRFLEASSWYGDTDIPLNHHGLWAITIYGTNVVGHGGNTSGCSSYLMLDPESGVGMTVMTNQAGESFYNVEMPELVFGKYQGQALDFSGYLVSARTIFRGPLKLQQLLNTFYITPEDTEEGLCVLSECGGMRILTQQYGEFMVKTLPELLVQYLPLMLWMLSLAFCLLNLIFRGIGWIVRRLRRRMPRKRVPKWTIAACVCQLLPLIPVLLALPSLFGWVMWPTWQYGLVFGSFLIWAAVYACLAVYGVREMARYRRAGAYPVTVVLTLAVSIFNIFYWELGAFWLL